jgi:hypothetical protein
MIPVSLYTPLYHHTMLLVVIGCSLLYWQGGSNGKSLTQFNQVFMIVLGVLVVLFMGLRPVSGIYFYDMGDYARAYESVQQGNKGILPDELFNGLMRVCAPVLPTAGFFVVCAFIYVVALALAFWRIHGAWAFPVFLACLTAFSFWGYGTNGIRNGMGMSVLILAFAFHDKPLVMFLLMAAAWGFHGTALLPATAFLLVRYVKKTEIWFVFWLVCVVASLLVGNIGEMLLSHYNPFAWDSRAESYVNSAGSGFRADFLLYSIVPVVVTLLMAAPTRARSRRLAARVMKGSALNWLRKRSATSVKGIGRARLAAFPEVQPAGTATLALGTPLSSLNPRPSARGRSRAIGGRGPSVPKAGIKQHGWRGLPWVQLLRSDPFYARLVNTYLLANTLWILVIYAEYSNRFAYLSWFMMPWVLLYPFVPGKVSHRPRTGMIAAVLCAQYMFTYLMGVVVYPLRGFQ